MSFCAYALAAAQGDPLRGVDYLESGVVLEGLLELVLSAIVITMAVRESVPRFSPAGSTVVCKKCRRNYAGANSATAFRSTGARRALVVSTCGAILFRRQAAA